MYTALSSSSTQPSIREAALYLKINQNIEAPELTNPPRMPQCLSSRKVSTALTEAINVRYAAQLKMNASVDTTYIQVNTGLGPSRHSEGIAGCNCWLMGGGGYS